MLVHSFFRLQGVIGVRLRCDMPQRHVGHYTSEDRNYYCYLSPGHNRGNSTVTFQSTMCATGALQTAVHLLSDVLQYGFTAKRAPQIKVVQLKGTCHISC